MEGITGGEIITIIIATLFINKILVNIYHEIPKRNRYLHAQTELLAEIALKLGVSNEDILELLQDAEEITARKKLRAATKEANAKNKATNEENIRIAKEREGKK
jgi:hypothetical protein